MARCRIFSIRRCSSASASPPPISASVGRSEKIENGGRKVDVAAVGAAHENHGLVPKHVRERGTQRDLSALRFHVRWAVALRGGERQCILTVEIGPCRDQQPRAQDEMRAALEPAKIGDCAGDAPQVDRGPPPSRQRGELGSLQRPTVAPRERGR
eukprot:1142299-Pleurochrysis_carterae.AAC.2